MRSKVIFLIVCLLSLSMYSKGLPTAWIMRNGLTDDQIDDIMNTNPNASLRLTKNQWMNLKYRLHRFHNVTNYLTSYIREGTNTFVKTIMEQRDRVENLMATNNSLVSMNRNLIILKDEYKKLADEWRTDATNAWNHYDISTNEFNSLNISYIQTTNSLAEVRNQLSVKSAELLEAIKARNTSESKARRAEYVKTKITELRDKAVLSTTKKIYNEILKLFDE